MTEMNIYVILSDLLVRFLTFRSVADEAAWGHAASKVAKTQVDSQV